MPRAAKPLWHKGNRSWFARVGEIDPETKRARAVYFNKPIPGADVPKGEKDVGGAWTYFNALRELRKTEWINTADPTIKGLADLYLEWCEARVGEGTMARGHLQTLQTRLGKFARFDPGGGLLGDRRARRVTVDDLEAYAQWLRRDSGHRPHYVRNCIRGVQALFSWATKEIPGREPRRIIERNPFERYRAPTVGRMPIRFAERIEAAAFLRFFLTAANGRRPDPRRFDRMTILLERVLIRTGCRPGEACRMRWDQIRWDDGISSAGHRFAKVILEEHKTAKKTEKPRIIFLTPTLTRAIRRLGDRPGHHPIYVFTHARGTKTPDDGTPKEWGDPWNSIALAKKVRDIRRAAIAAGAKFEDTGANRLVNYRWRHTAISTLLMMGVDVATVGELTGTSPEMIRSHYGHILTEHLAAAAEKLQGKLKLGGRPRR